MPFWAKNNLLLTIFKPPKVPVPQWFLAFRSRNIFLQTTSPCSAAITSVKTQEVLAAQALLTPPPRLIIILAKFRCDFNARARRQTI
jgi:hypothetical protein